MSFKGDLSTIGLAEVFQMISMSQKEGTLIVQDAESRKAIYFGKEGVQLLSSGRRKGFRIGDLLVRAGKISVGQLREVLEKQEQTKKLLGEELIDAGIVTQEDIEEVVRSQIEEEIYDLFLWKKAAFEFIEGPPIDELRDPDSRAIRLALDVNGLLLEAVRRTDEWTIINQKIPSMDCVYAFVSEATRAEADATARDSAKAVYANVDGQATVNDVIEAALVPRFEVCKVLVELLDGGRIRMLSASETAAVAKQRLEEGRREKGFRLFQVAALLAPEDPDLIGTYAHALETEGMIQDAARMYVKVGNLLKVQGAGKDALAYFQRAVMLNPDDAQSKAALFEINIASGNVEEALQTANEVIANALKDKDFTTARVVAEQAVAAAPSNAEMRLALARVYHGLELKAERDQILNDLRKNLPVDQAAADRMLAEMRQLSDQPKEQPKLITTSSRTKRERGAFKRTMIVAAIILIVVALALAGFWAKYEYDANTAYVGIKGKSFQMEHSGNWSGAKATLQSFETQYPSSMFTLPKMRDDLAALSRREAESKRTAPPVTNGHTTNPPPVDEDEEKRKAAKVTADQMVSKMDEVWKAAQHDDAIRTAINLVDHCDKWPKESWSAPYRKKAKEIRSDVEGYLAKAHAMATIAEEQILDGRYKDACGTIKSLKEIYHSTKVAQEALYPLHVVCKPRKVKVLKSNGDGGWVELFEGDESLLRIRPDEKFTLRFQKHSFSDVEIPINGPMIGEVWAVLDQKRELWAWPAGIKFSSAPEVFAGQIYVAGGEAVYAINNQCKQVWQQSKGLAPSIATAPRFHPNRTIYVGCGKDLVCLDPTKASDASEIWRFTAKALISSPPAFSSDGSVAYFGGEDGNLYAVEVGKDPGVALLYTQDLKKPVRAEPVEARGVLYVACTDGVLYAFKIGEKDLEQLWAFEAGGVLESSPYLAGKTIFIGSSNRKVYAVDAEKGTKLWEASVGGAIQATPMLANSTLFVPCSDKFMYAFDTGNNGALLWKFPTKGALTSSPLVVGAQVLFGSEDGNFYCVNSKTGEQEWRFATNGRIRQSASRGDGVVYFGSDDKSLYCVPIDAE